MDHQLDNPAIALETAYTFLTLCRMRIPDRAYDVAWRILSLRGQALAAEIDTFSRAHDLPFLTDDLIKTYRPIVMESRPVMPVKGRAISVTGSDTQIVLPPDFKAFDIEVQAGRDASFEPDQTPIYNLLDIQAPVWKNNSCAFDAVLSSLIFMRAGTLVMDQVADGEALLNPAQHHALTVTATITGTWNHAQKAQAYQDFHVLAREQLAKRFPNVHDPTSTNRIDPTDVLAVVLPGVRCCSFTTAEIRACLHCMDPSIRLQTTRRTHLVRQNKVAAGEVTLQEHIQSHFNFRSGPTGKSCSGSLGAAHAIEPIMARTIIVDRPPYYLVCADGWTKQDINSPTSTGILSGTFDKIRLQLYHIQEGEVVLEYETVGLVLHPPSHFTFAFKELGKAWMLHDAMAMRPMRPWDGQERREEDIAFLYILRLLRWDRLESAESA